MQQGPRGQNSNPRGQNRGGSRGRGRGGNSNRGRSDQNSWREKETSEEREHDVQTEGLNYLTDAAMKTLGVNEPKPTQDKKEQGKKIELGFSINEVEALYLKSKYPGYYFTYSPGRTPHDHPFIAVERIIVEDYICNKFANCNAVIDIGGKPQRHVKNKRHGVWVCNPGTEPDADVQTTFLKMATTTSQRQYCTCDPMTDIRATDCEHPECPDFMFTIYPHKPPSPELIYHAIGKSDKSIFVMAFRHFPEITGALHHGELVYERDEKEVRFKTKKSNQTYKLPDESWMLSSSFWTNGSEALAWSVLTTIGDTKILIFVSSKPDRDTSTMCTEALTLEGMLKNPQCLGTLKDIRSILSKDAFASTLYEFNSFPAQACFSLYGTLIFYDDTTHKRAIVPKEAVNVLRIYVSGQHRDSHLLASTFQKAKDVLKKYNMSPQHIADSLPAVVTLAFYGDVKLELSTLVYYDWKYKASVAKLNRALALNTIPVYPVLATTTSILLVLLLILWRKRKTGVLNRRVFSYVKPMSIIDIIQSFFGFLTSLFAKQMHNGSSFLPPWITSPWYKLVRCGTRVYNRVYRFAISNVGPACVNHHAPIHYPDICNKNRPRAELHRDAAVTEPPLPDCTERHGATQYGVAVNIAKPLIARSCTCNELVAVVNRGCLNRDEASPALWSILYTLSDQIIPVVEGSPWVVDGRLKAPHFDAWVLRFPPQRREELRRARREMQSINSRPQLAIKAFVKKEFQFKSSVVSEGHDEFVNVETYDPRLIQGRSPVYQVVTGPTTYAWSKYLAWLWSPECAIYNFVHMDDDPLGRRVTPKPDDPRPRTNIIYISGLNAEQLGAAVEKSIDYLSMRGHVVHSESDASRFDARTGGEAVECKNRPYRRFKAKPAVRKLLAREVSIGHTRHGVSYTMTYTIKSGEGDTSSGDSNINGTLSKGVAELADIPDADWITFVAGDDNYTIMLGRHAPKHADINVRVWTLAGYRIEQLYVHSLYDVEFCSGRFYPTNDGIVFGPKIGRIIAKSFHSRTQYNDHMGRRWLRAVAQGLHKDTHFIPVLRVIIRKTIELTDDVQAIEIRPEEKIHASAVHHASMETFEMLSHLYDLSVAQIAELEAWLDVKIKSLPCTISHPYLDKIIERDVLADDSFKRKSQFTPPMLSLGLGLTIKLAAALILFRMHPYLNQRLIDLLKHFDPSNDFTRELFQSCIVAPIVEESVKALHPMATHAIFLLEAYRSVLIGGYPGLAAYSITGLQHYLWAWIGRSKGGLPLAMLLHSLWNVFALNCKYNETWIRTIADKFEYVPQDGSVSRGIHPIKILVAFILLRGVHDLVQTNMQNIGHILDKIVNLIGRHSPRMEQTFDYLWAISSKAWNKLMHAINGNMEINVKGKLLELCTKHGIPAPVYRDTMSGPSHMPTFHCQLDMNIRGETFLFTASAASKKTAQSLAAAQAVSTLEKFMEANSLSYKLKTMGLTDPKLGSPLKEAYLSEFAWATLFIDADQISPKQMDWRIHAHQTFICGVSTSITNWKKVLEAPHKLGVVKHKIVPVSPDAADIAITEAVERLKLTNRVCVLTGDKRFAAKVKGLGAFCTGIPGEAVIDRQFALTRISENLLRAIEEVIANVDKPPEAPPGFVADW